VRKVVRSMVDRVRTVCRLGVADDASRSLFVTPGHPFYEGRRGAYVSLRDLPPESELTVLRNGQTGTTSIATLAVEERPDPTFEVFNLEIEGPEHNFFAEGILVHNKVYCQPICGDDFISWCPAWDGRREECDDGNTVDGDGCSALCERELASGDGGAGGEGGETQGGAGNTAR